MLVPGPASTRTSSSGGSSSANSDRSIALTAAADSPIASSESVASMVPAAAAPTTIAATVATQSRMADQRCRALQRATPHGEPSMLPGRSGSPIRAGCCDVVVMAGPFR